jgi:hypothetical protein
MQPKSSWDEAFAEMWHRLLDDIVACRGYTPEEADSLRAKLDRHERLFRRPVRPSLLHMDEYDPGIVQLNNGGEQKITPCKTQGAGSNGAEERI